MRVMCGMKFTKGTLRYVALFLDIYIARYPWASNYSLRQSTILLPSLLVDLPEIVAHGSLRCPAKMIFGTQNLLCLYLCYSAIAPITMGAGIMFALNQTIFFFFFDIWYLILWYAHCSAINVNVVFSVSPLTLWLEKLIFRAQQWGT